MNFNASFFLIAIGICLTISESYSIYIITLPPFPFSNKNHETQHISEKVFETALEQNVYERVHNKVEKIKEMTSVEKIFAIQLQESEIEKQRKDIENLQKEIINLRKDCANEKKERLKLEAQFDFVELIKQLFEDCYPQWAEAREKNDFSPAVWHSLLLNIENPRVIQIRQQMKRDNVDEKTFVEVMEEILRGRLRSAHQALTDRQREEAYPEWLAVTSRCHKTAIAALLMFSCKVEEDKVIALEYRPSTTTTLSPEDSKLISNVVEEAKQNRSHLNLLVISSKPYISSKSEKDLQNIVHQDLEIRACFKQSDTAYLLFKDFNDAYAAMQQFKKNGVTEKFLITNVNDWKFHSLQNPTLKVEPQKLSASRDVSGE